MRPMPQAVVTDVRNYPAANMCIYCGSSNELTTEHIIPLGLGGRWKFPRSSCKDCAAHTAKIEQFCLRRLFWPARIRLDMPSRRKTQRPKALPLRFLFADGEKRDIEVPMDQYPSVLTMVKFELPGIFLGDDKLFRRGTRDFIVNCFQDYSDFRKTLKHIAAKHGAIDAEVVSTLEAGMFGQFLAKIAHSFYIANHGVDRIERAMLEIISGDHSRYSPSYFVGGVKEFVEPGTEIHEVTFDQYIAEKTGLITVRIRLFACLAMPVYYVVVAPLTAIQNSDTPASS